MLDTAPPSTNRWALRRAKLGNNPAKVPGTTTDLLSTPSKMPCASFNLPAIVSCPWAHFGDNAICGQSRQKTSCYATKNRYRFWNVRNPLKIRFGWASRCMRNITGQLEFVGTLHDAISKLPDPSYFRIHDSGDFFSPEYVWAWYHIARNLPDTKFWAPTRSWRAAWTVKGERLPDKPEQAAKIIVSRVEWRHALTNLAALPNVTVRPSALLFDTMPPRIPELAAGGAAWAEGYNCPAKSQGNVCGNCRKCWDEPLVEIQYHKH